MKRWQSLARYLLSTTPPSVIIARNLETPEQLQDFLIRYNKYSKIARTSLHVLVPLLSAIILLLAGQAWMWALPVILVVSATYRQVLGISALSRSGRSELWEMVSRAATSQWVISVYPMEKAGISESSHEDMMELCLLTLTPEGRALVQSRALNGKTQAAPIVASPTPRRL